MINTDAVTRTVYYKGYFHPKEAVVTDGVTNREILRLAGKRIDEESAAKDTSNPLVATASGGFSSNGKSPQLPFVYPFGATLNVQKPGTVLLSSGSVSYPLQRPIAAAYHQNLTSRLASAGKLVVVGSCEVFGDSYLDKEGNCILWDSLLKYLTIPGTVLNAVDAEDPEVDANVHTAYSYLHICLDCG